MAFEFTYAAFISYRHLPRDAEVAKQVQEAIETYRIPRGAQIAEGFQAGRPLGKCFRDEDELAAAHSLPESIVEALSASSALVVICSPETRESTWVTREIEAFIEVHGQERVFCVLVDGSSAECIPEILRTKKVLDTQGVERTVPAGPLAADLRPEASAKHAEEKLRIIAAIAGCGYDDLRQRTRARKRKRIFGGVAAALALVAVIAGFGWSAYNNQQTALLEESRTLTAQAQQLYQEGDRYAAIEAVLAALPTSGTDTSRPFLPEAQTVLRQTLNLDGGDKQLWFPAYALTLEHNASALAVNERQGWFAVLDDALGLTVFDTLTGKQLSTCALPKPSSGSFSEVDLDLTNWTLVVAGDYLVAAQRNGSGVIACFEAVTGELNWSNEPIVADAIAVSGDGRTLDIFYNGEEALMAAAIDVATGETLGIASFTDPGLTDFPVFLPASIGDDTSVMYVGIGGSLVEFDIKNEETNLYKHDLGGQVIWSVAHAGSTTLLALSERPDESFAATAHWQALSSELEPVWSAQADWRFELVGQGESITAIDGWPRVWQTAYFGEDAFVCSAGSALRAYSLENGEELISMEMPAPILSVGCSYESDATDFAFVACGDGSIKHVLSNASQYPMTRGSALDYVLPCEIDWASVSWTADSAFYVIARDANDPKHIVVSIGDSLGLSEDKAKDASLDELIAMAHDALEEAGRG